MRPLQPRQRGSNEPVRAELGGQVQGSPQRDSDVPTGGCPAAARPQLLAGSLSCLNLAPLSTQAALPLTLVGGALQEPEVSGPGT